MRAFRINAMFGVFLCICVVCLGAPAYTYERLRAHASVCVFLFMFHRFFKISSCFSLTCYVCEMFFNASNYWPRSFCDPLCLDLNHSKFTFWHIHFIYLLLISSLYSVCYLLYLLPTYPSVNFYVLQNSLQI